MATITNTGFDETYYLTEKAAQLTASTGQTWNVASVQAAFTAAGLTAEEHYNLYGYNEGLSPNAYYDDNYYAASKAAEAGMSVADFRLAWLNASGSDNLYTHYMQYGAFESSVEPSSGFDDDAYYAAKAAKDGTTADAVKAAIQDAGLNAISHYLLYGQYEGLDFTATPINSSTNSDTVTLTTGADVKTANVFNAPLVTEFGTPNLQTINSSDVLTGSGTNPTLNASLSTGGTTTPKMTGVQTLNLLTTAVSTLDMQNSTGVVNVINHDATAALTVTNLALINPTDTAAGTALTVTNDGGVATTVRFTDASLAGTADAVTVNLNNSTGLITLADVSGSNKIETLNITSTGDIGATKYNGNATSNFTGVTTINVEHSDAGDANLNLGGGNANFTGLTATTIDATGFAANLRATLGAVDTKITGGDGNDHFNFLGHLNSGDVVDGGLGVNGVSADISGLTLSGLHLTNIQSLGLGVEGQTGLLGQLTANGSVDLAGVTGLTDLQVGSGVTAAPFTSTISNAPSTMVNIVDHGIGSIAAAQTADNLLFKTSYTGTNDSVTFTIDNIDANGAHVANTNAYTTGTINFSDTSATNGVESLTINAADHSNVLLSTITDSTLHSLTLTSTGNIDSTTNGATILAGSSAVTGATNSLASINATGVTGHLGAAGNVFGIDGLANHATVTLGNGGSNILLHGTGSLATDAYTVTGGTGADTIAGDTAGADALLGNLTVHGGGGADVITGAAGVDTLYGDAGNDIITASTGGSSITGGTGADTLTGAAAAVVDTFNFAQGDSALGSATAAATNMDTITNFAPGTDIIHDTSGALSLMATGTGGLTIVTGVVTAGAATLSDFVTAASASTTAQASVVYDDGTHEYLFISDGVAGLTDGDLLIKLTGLTGDAAVTITNGNITNIA